MRVTRIAGGRVFHANGSMLSIQLSMWFAFYLETGNGVHESLLLEEGKYVAHLIRTERCSRLEALDDILVSSG